MRISEGSWRRHLHTGLPRPPLLQLHSSAPGAKSFGDLKPIAVCRSIEDLGPTMSQPSLLEALKAANESPSIKLPQDPTTRKEMLTELRQLNAKLESPMDSIMQYVFQVCGC